jgi:hypothetical protein
VHLGAAAAAAAPPRLAGAGVCAAARGVVASRRGCRGRAGEREPKGGTEGEESEHVKVGDKTAASERM